MMPSNAQVFCSKLKKKWRNKLSEMRQKHNVCCGVFWKIANINYPTAGDTSLSAQETDRPGNKQFFFFYLTHVFFVCATPCIDINVQTHTFTPRLCSTLKAVQRQRMGKWDCRAAWNSSFCWSLLLCSFRQHSKILKSRRQRNGVFRHTRKRRPP